MKCMSKLGRKMKSVKIVMMMALLFCVFLCPHGADASLDECSAFEPVVECQDLCDCPEPVEHNDFCADSCVYDYRDDTSIPVEWNFDYIDWSQVVLLLDERTETVHYPCIDSGFSSHSFTIRHLDSIILRV